MKNSMFASGHSPACAAAHSGPPDHVAIPPDGPIHAVQHLRKKAVYYPLIRLFGPHGNNNPVAVVEGHLDFATCDCEQFRESWDCPHVAVLAQTGHLVFTTPYTPSEPLEGGVE